MRVIIFLYIIYFAVLHIPVDARITDGSRPSSSGMEYFKSGMEAAQLGEDEQAVSYFMSARDDGYDSSRLDYNLGVVLIRLGRYTEAARAFRRAASDAELTALAEYNLGLIALHMGHWPEARDRFRRAEAAALTPELSALSGLALDRLSPGPKPYMVIAELTAGYDNAASIRADDLGGGETKDDLFAAVWLYADHWLTGNSYRGVQIFGSLYALSFDEESTSDLLLLEAGAGIRQPVDIFGVGASVTGRHNRLDGDPLENSVEFALEGRRLLFPDNVTPGPVVSLRYRFELIDGGRHYAYLNGTKQDIRARISMPVLNGSLAADYALEHNDRDDLLMDEHFLSASPLRHRIGISYRKPISDAFYVLTEASWRNSEFRGDNSLPDGSFRQRRDNRLTLAGNIAYRRDRLTPFVRGEWMSNSSNIAYYDYDQIRLFAGVEWLL